MKKLVIVILFSLLLAALGFSVFSIYQTEYWADFVKIFGPLGLGLVVLVLLIVATIIGEINDDF